MFCIILSRIELEEPLLSSRHDSEDLGSSGIVSIDEEEDKKENPALMFSTAVPHFFRHAVPIVTIGTIYLLGSSNLSTGASVDLHVSLPDSKTIGLPSLFAFSLGNTVREFYHAGIWALLFLVLVFSGMWPNIKLKLMLFAWAAPERAMATERRERLLLSLDALGKFSLVDTYVLVLMLVAFRFHLDLAEQASINVFVTPGLGFYGFLLATSASLVIGHVILFFHRKSVVGHYPSSEPKESLAQHGFEDRTTGRLKRMTRRFQIFVVAMILSTFVHDVDQDTVVPIENVEASIFQALLHFIYSDRLPDSVDLKIDTPDLLLVADKFDYTSLKLVAEAKLEESGITVDTISDLLLLADGMNCALLKEAAMRFFVDNWTAVVKTEGYAKMLAKSPKILDELMRELAKPIGFVEDETNVDSMRVTSLRRKLDERGLDVDGTREMLAKPSVSRQVRRKMLGKSQIQSKTLRKNLSRNRSR